MLAAVIVLCLWSLRTVRNAKQRDPSLNVSPGLACGSWYIPIGNFWLPVAAAPPGRATLRDAQFRARPCGRRW